MLTVRRNAPDSLCAVIAALTADAWAAAEAEAPAGVELRRLPDGLEEAAFVVPAWDDKDAVELLPRLGSLRIVQTLSAGTDWVEDRVPPWAALCNARGTRDIPVAEWVVGALLGALYGQFTAAAERAWDHRRPRELHGRTVLIVGHGSIGRTVKDRLHAFGTRVIGVASKARKGVHGIDEIDALLPAADAVVVLLPLTGDTRGLVDAPFLARMRDGALFVNAGRGAVVDTDALVAELERGRIEAVLDVVDPEPLPAGHRLWELALAITPHNAGDSPGGDERAARLAAKQLARFARGEPLNNVVRAPSAPREGVHGHRPDWTREHRV
jgi:phosphoglycerate dehydrogenase-like enzyme